MASARAFSTFSIASKNRDTSTESGKPVSRRLLAISAILPLFSSERMPWNEFFAASVA